ncbi:hypothetical protein [Methylobacterium sp. WL19]|uniref:hypothetical protein n=1 Tax=Methylobacterium sp. WL19 TaxID=2603896 RepID=UPI0011C77E53|nr:hypothetical protein [Methylobacterium sp. WL19]TXN33504.1 hypothetical protein FV220_01835 [Methylobacterium sp. WL19]
MLAPSHIHLHLRACPRRPEEVAHQVIHLGDVTVGPETGDLLYVGRDACMRGPHGVVPLDREAYNLALAERVDELAGAVWGDDWSRALAELAGINRRTTARDRIRKYGLPPALLYGLVKLSEREDAREISAVARAVARYWDVHQRAPADAPLRGMIELLHDFRGQDAFRHWQPDYDVSPSLRPDE